MDIKILVFLSLFFGTSLAQDIECVYTERYYDGTDHYICNLNINNPDGFNNFTSIIGTHLPGKTDADVSTIKRGYPSISTIFPTILCSQFPNLNEIDFIGIGLERIYEESLSDCVNVRELWLEFNNLEDVHERAFVHNTKLSLLLLYNNKITNLPENVFDSLVNLKELSISSNPIVKIPDGLFKGLINLDILSMENLNLNSLNPIWFENFANLGALIIARNNLTALPEEIFSKMKNLWGLDISRNPIGNNIPASELRNLRILEMESIGLSDVNPEFFEHFTNLEELNMARNLLTSIPEGTFDNLTNLTGLNIGDVGLDESGIPGNMFEKLSQLSFLSMRMNKIRNLNPQWFQNLPKLTNLFLDQNQIRELPVGIFAPISNLRYIYMFDNHIEVISRHAFGNISNLDYVSFSYNRINAIDETFLRGAYPLTNLHLYGNLCISETFFNFWQSKEYYLTLLKACTTNFQFIVEATTERGEAYRFYTAPNSGIRLSVKTNQEIRIALTPFNILWNPSVEIVIGTNNNTLSTIIRNQNTEVVVAHSPNIIRPGQWIGLRITWSNHIIFVMREEQDSPFLVYNLQDLFPVQFYGIRSPESRAVWRIQPNNW